MDFVTLLALILFAGMIVSWFVLPATAATGVADQDAPALGVPAADKA
jgi:hypothetical protein